MVLGKERQSRCKKKCNEYGDGESCSHRSKLTGRIVEGKRFVLTE